MFIYLFVITVIFSLSHILFLFGARWASVAELIISQPVADAVSQDVIDLF